MWRCLANLIQWFDGAGYRQRIECALALHLRGEVRRDGLEPRRLSNRLEIEWWARDIHPWDRDDPPERRAWLFYRQALTDTEAALARLFRALPQVDVIALKVLERNSESVLLAGTAHRSAVEPDAELSVGMRLWRRGITYRTAPGSMSPGPLEAPEAAPAGAGECVPAALLTGHARPGCPDNYILDIKIPVSAQFSQSTASAVVAPDAIRRDSTGKS